MSVTVSAELLEKLIAHASLWTGFRPDAILRHSVTEVANQRLRGCTESQLSHAIEMGEAGLVHDICQAVSVGETYFFRNPDQFEVMVREVDARFVRPQRGAPNIPLRIWSAGCATGEEAYSLAAFLRMRLPPGVTLDVLGTDLVARNVEAARMGRYGSWSVRNDQPLAPVLRRNADGRLEITSDLHGAVTFAEHNLLLETPKDFGKFHVIFCRNVLVYFGRESAARAVAHLRASLYEGGLLLFGSMDVTELPPGLRRAGPTEFQMYERDDRPANAAPAPSTKSQPPRSPISQFPRRPSSPPPAPSSPSRPPLPRVEPKPPEPVPEPVAIHLRGLTLIEGGDLDGADKLLEALCRQAPNYLPGQLERALLHLRLGERSSGGALMRDLLQRCQSRPGDEVLAAPEPMTVAFVKASAKASLRGLE